VDTAGLSTDQTVTVIVADVNEAPSDITLGSAPTALTTSGNASLVSGTTYQLTPNAQSQSGAVWGAVNLAQDVTITSKMFFGANNNGADGMAFAFQNQSATAAGTGAAGFGVAGVSSAFGISFDTYFNNFNNEINSDSTQFFRQGQTHTQGTAFDTANAHDNIEDGLWHDVVIVWNASTKTLSYSLDGVAIDSKTYDVVATDWGGNANGFFGFGAGTGGSTNQQQVEIISVQTGSTTAIAENSTSGAVVGLAAAVDPDRTGTVTYSLTDTAGGRFAINSSTGQITVASGAVLDAEVNSNHRIVVQATDQGSQSFNKTLTINVSNVNEAPVDVSTSIQNVTVANFGFESGVLPDNQSSAATSWVATGSAGQWNPSTSHYPSGSGTEGSNVGYANQGGSLSQTVATNFDSSTNYRLTVDVGTKLDQPLHTFAVRLYAGSNLLGVYNGASTTPGTWQTINLDINGSQFAAYQGQALKIELANTSSYGSQTNFDNVRLDSSTAIATIAENSSNGAVVTTVTGLDRDAGNTLTYSLTNNAGGRFAINSTTGQITVANGSLLDFEAATSHAVVVRGTDQGGLTYDRTMTIAVTNASEAPTAIAVGSAANLVTNGTMEAGVGTYTAGVAPTGWTATGASGGFSMASRSSEGSGLVAFNGNGSTIGGQLSQTINTVAGQTYTLAFDMAGHGDATNLTNHVLLVEAISGGTTVLSQNATDSTTSTAGAGTGAGYNTYTYTFTASRSTRPCNKQYARGTLMQRSNSRKSSAGCKGNGKGTLIASNKSA
jgi:hypothetical protein